jgi:UDP-N-acetylglucosamine transferase subunit ALG13
LIFVTIGSAVKGVEFTRLIKKMDKVAREIDEEVVMQIGTITYEPRNAKYFRYTSYQENLSFFQKASLVVGHCGIGTILNALRFKKPLIVVPRRIKYGELNRDDHQIEIAQRLEGKELIEVVYDVENLESAIKRMLERERYVTKGESSFEKDNLIKTLQEFIKSCT